ncbi:MAG: DUF2442 domain-containing protein [Beijerinckiaceae bacterium]
MIQLVKVTAVQTVQAYKLAIHFSDGTTGIHDFEDIVAEGGSMLDPLKDVAFFQRVFIEFGVLAWPNGFDIDAIALHADMKSRGLLAKAA